MEQWLSVHCGVGLSSGRTVVHLIVGVLALGGFFRLWRSAVLRTFFLWWLFWSQLLLVVGGRLVVLSIRLMWSGLEFGVRVSVRIGRSTKLTSCEPRQWIILSLYGLRSTASMSSSCCARFHKVTFAVAMFRSGWRKTAKSKMFRHRAGVSNGRGLRWVVDLLACLLCGHTCGIGRWRSYCFFGRLFLTLKKGEAETRKRLESNHKIWSNNKEEEKRKGISKCASEHADFSLSL